MGESPFQTAVEREAGRIRKRDAVLNAAVRMFNERGFHATSLDDVANSLGVSKPTIYHYLGNKEQVLFECVTRGLDQLRIAAAEARTLPGTGLERLRSFLLRYAEIVMEDYGRCVVRTPNEDLSGDSGDRFLALKREIHDELRKMIADAVVDRSVAPLDIRLTAYVLAGALNWPARWYQAEGGESASDLAVQLVDILTVGLAPRQAADRKQVRKRSRQTVAAPSKKVTDRKRITKSSSGGAKAAPRAAKKSQRTAKKRS